MITGDDAQEAQAKPDVRRYPSRIKVKEWYWCFGILSASTALAGLMFPYFDRTDIAMIYLLGIVVTSMRTGRWAAFVATVMNVAAFDFFFVPPYFSFGVNDIRFFVTFGVMFVVAYVITQLTLQVRERSEASRMRERSTASLYGLSRELTRERKRERIFTIAAKHIKDVFQCRIVIFIVNEQGELALAETDGSAFAIDEKERGVALWVFDNRQSAGLGTDTLPGSSALYLPMVASSGVVGVVGVLPDSLEKGKRGDDTHHRG